jgi:hypothetical protein
MGAAKITATVNITTLLNMAPPPVIHLITLYVLALASRVNQPMAVICCRTKSAKLMLFFTVFPS